MNSGIHSLTTLKNIGASLATKLQEVGIRTETDLREVGAARAFRRLVARHPSAGMLVWFYLFSLEGALQNVPWSRVSSGRMRELLRTLSASSTRSNGAD